VANQAGLLRYLSSGVAAGGGLGMETLDVEVESIAEQTANLAKIHVYLYESGGTFVVVDV
jgi:hypothetical protein